MGLFGVTLADAAHDPDRVFCGDKIDMTVIVEMDRLAGRAAYSDYEISASGQVNDDWNDPELKRASMS